MTPRAFRTFALSLLGAHEEPHFERASFRVGTKIFATLAPTGTEAMVRVAPLEKVEALLQSHPEAFFDHGTWTWKNGALGVRLDHVEAALIRSLVAEAHARLAPKVRAKAPARRKATR